MSSKIGKYDILEILGRGGMGVVYKAYDPILDREIALKTMTDEAFKDPVLRERFYREARAAGRLRHPNIVTIYELGEENNMPYIAMEYLPGTDVHHLIRMRKPMPLDRKIHVVIQLCRGLAYAHRAGIIHRDIKPSNIRLIEDVHVKILDFGVARLITSQTMSSDGIVLGTLHYMSPEQVKGTHVDAKSDIFSVGIIFYELLTYKRPFEADNTASVLFKIVGEPPDKMDPPLDTQFPSIKKALQKSLDKDPAKRYFSADEMADDLENFLKQFTPGKDKVENVQTVEYSLLDVVDLETPKSDPRAVELLRTAKRLIVEGHAVQALASLRQAREIEPTNPEISTLMKSLEEDIRKGEEEELFNQGQAYLKEGRFDIAVKAFEKLLKLNPNNSKARVVLESVKADMMLPRIEERLQNARKAYADKNYQVALTDVQEVLKIYPQHHEAQEIHGVLKERITQQQFSELMHAAERFLSERQYETAVKAFRKALKIYPHHPVALKRLKDAEAGLRRLQIEQHIVRGNRQLELGNYSEAMESFDAILKIDPKNETAKMVLEYISNKMRVEEVQRLLNLGWRTLMMDKKYEEVKEIARRVLSLDPNNSEAQGLLQAAEREE